MKKADIINKLINIVVSPNYQGRKAEQERINWRKELNKHKKSELLIDLENSVPNA